MTDTPTPTPTPEDSPQPAAPAPQPTPAAQPEPPAAPVEAAAAPAAAAPAAEAAAPQPEPRVKNVNDPHAAWGTGRRKSSVARVRIKPGEGKFIINKKDADEYFKVDVHRHLVRQPLAVAEAGNTWDVFCNVNGGGITGQAGAIALGLSRALAKADGSLQPKLREAKLMSRDPRKVERKKYGRAGARKRFQFSKR